jgi:hypothetical protein
MSVVINDQASIAEKRAGNNDACIAFEMGSYWPDIIINSTASYPMLDPPLDFYRQSFVVDGTTGAEIAPLIAEGQHKRQKPM